jgi:hypothetical protein
VYAPRDRIWSMGTVLLNFRHIMGHNSHRLLRLAVPLWFEINLCGGGGCFPPLGMQKGTWSLPALIPLLNHAAVPPPFHV